MMTLFIEWLCKGQPEMNALAEKSVEAALKAEGITNQIEVSLTVVDNDEIQTINHEQRGKDVPTDVLSFPMIEYDLYDSVESAIAAEPMNPDNGLIYLGDIVISWDKVLEQKEAYGHGINREFSFLIVHSMLHLLGYDHMNDDDEKVMTQRQKVIMSDLGIERWRTVT